MTRPLLTALVVALGALAVWTASGDALEESVPAAKTLPKQHSFAESKHPTLTLLYTIGNQGYIEPCG